MRARAREVAKASAELLVAKGASVVDPALVRDLVSTRRRNDPLAGLSAREQEVLALMADGRTTSEIADRLAISGLTVQSHVKNIFTKLGVHSKVEAIRFAWRSGMLEIPIGA